MQGEYDDIVNKVLQTGPMGPSDSAGHTALGLQFADVVR